MYMNLAINWAPRYLNVEAVIFKAIGFATVADTRILSATGAMHEIYQQGLFLE